MEQPLPDLPDEMITEIMSWLPPESLIRFKSVSKKWFSMIQDRRFIEKHMSRSNYIQQFAKEEEEENPGIGGGTKEAFSIWNTCHGLLLERSNLTKKFRIRNPATRQVLDLPDHRPWMIIMELYFVPSACDYRVASIYSDVERDGYVFCEVLSLGSKDKDWRLLEVGPLRDLIKRGQKGWILSMNGVIYFIATGEDGFWDSGMLCLDMVNEAFTRVNVPRRLFPSWKMVKFFDWDHKPSVASIVEDRLIIWVLEDVRNQIWAKNKIVVPMNFMKENPAMKNFKPFAACDGNLWLYGWNHRMICYDIAFQTIRDLSSLRKKCLYVYKQTLVTLQGMRTEEEQPREDLPSYTFPTL
ncbi:putative F-box protein At3g52320 [Diospyros lotus]|uniref:putative F-box protein At3g52320 n=1 Tax=Diospyros lotus TaxID=55363 RepID=UPI00225260F5|nr:putative F-box protein At3g52320 [Diospyros lotus]XP_052180945.1 putative F-box protein At3g52320 [Diospyros lotus]